MRSRTLVFVVGLLAAWSMVAPGASSAAVPADYEENLELIRESSPRNSNHDTSPWRNVAQADLVIDNHLGPRSEYMGNPGGHPEQSFPTLDGGNFRISCEFSHFAYDDPLLFPDQPGAAHLHVFWGNTDANAFSTYESIRDSGSSTCNGQELNRTGYWAPALFDAAGNVRIPERIDIYYKGYGLANGRSQTYPERMAMIATDKVHEISDSVGGAAGEVAFRCTDQWRGFPREPAGDTIPVCDGSKFFDEYGVTDNPHVVLEMSVKFPQCWNGNDPSNPDNHVLPRIGSWFYSECEERVTFPNMEYIIQYKVEVGEDTAGWYLSSDVDPHTGRLSAAPGSTVHADWWGGWHPEINRMWIDNCVNFSTDVPSGCGHGYLTDGGPDNQNPLPGPALKFRPQYQGPHHVPVAGLHAQLCPGADAVGQASEAAYCQPAGHGGHGGDGGDGSHDGVFVDVDDSVHQADIEALAASGITRGCNPPTNDRFCPDDVVTRGQMAAFLNRALPGVPALQPAAAFTDTGGSVFASDIAWLAATGITRGCSPTAFCPDSPVTRGQMAAFLVRGLGLPAGSAAFVDAPGNVFEADIATLASAGITRGCNPPANDRFCPDEPVTRAQMASFLVRALGL
jgi:hypothetical protein